MTAGRLLPRPGKETRTSPGARCLQVKRSKFIAPLEGIACESGH